MDYKNIVDVKFDKNYKWLYNNTIYVCQTGSKAYGTNIETSDDDFRGVSLGRKVDYLGLRDSFQQYTLNDPDFVVFEFKKVLKLLSEGNPNTIEILFVEPNDIKYITPVGEKLLAFRDNFITKSCKEKFLGYAKAQLARLKLHRGWLLSPITVKPERKDFGLPDKLQIPSDQYEVVNALIRKELDSWNPNFEPFSDAQKIWLQNTLSDYLTEIQIYSDKLWMAAARKIGYSENFVEILVMEKRFESAKKHFDNYQDWKKNRNPTRAEMEAKVGFDCKHGVHLIRLSRMCREILDTGKVIVKRPDAEELLEIRNGHWSYEKVMEEFEKIQDQVKIAYEKSTLPKTANLEKIDEFVISILEENIFQ